MDSSNTDQTRNRRQSMVGQGVEIDMTPMTDLAFLLLTFFMLTTTFSQPQTMEVVMPAKPKDDTQEQAVKESQALTLLLSADDEIFWYQGITDPLIQKTDFGEKGIHKLLLELQASIPKLMVLIKADEKATYQNLVDILDEMNSTQTRRYAVVDIEPEDKALIKSYTP
ncbi:MAG: biopolymer transporter ExbD [Bacteroidota bacterium]